MSRRSTIWRLAAAASAEGGLYGWLIAVSLEELDDGMGCGFGFLFGGVVAGSFQDEAGHVC